MINSLVYLLSLIARRDLIRLCVLCECVGLSLDSDDVREAIIAHGSVPPTEQQ
jgi:hypothetical protein